MPTINWKSKTGWIRMWIVSVALVFVASYAEHETHLADQYLPMFLLLPAIDVYNFLCCGISRSLTDFVLFTSEGRSVLTALSVTLVYCIFSAVVYFFSTWIYKGFKAKDQEEPN